MAPVSGHRVTIEKFIADNEVAIFSKSTCPFCVKVKALFDELNVKYTALELDQIDNGADIHADLKALSSQNSVPNVYINGTHIGGNDTVQTLHKNNELLKLLKNMSFDYELIVVGGGSGGLAAAKAAADLGHSVAVCDYVQPSPAGTTWGLGGTCVNVGCIPKKLMHTAAIMQHSLKDSKAYGFDTPDVPHNWKKMVDNIQDHIGGLNWNYKVDLREKNATYLNSYATFIDNHTIKTVNKKGKEQIVTGEKFLIATGGRPRYPDIPGAKEYCITSDDIFSLPYSPGKTLCVGASYISLETAGFLRGMGYDVTVMVRSILLRGFDQQMAGLIGDHMEEQGVTFVRECVPTKVELIEEGSPGRYKVTGKYTKSDDEWEEEFNTIIFAIGRDPITTQIGLADIGVELNEKSGKVIVDEGDKSSVDNIYAIGDIREGGLELTPVAIQAGRLLIKRLYADSDVLTDYINVPTTVFTPLEYGCCGYSEEDAKAKFGEDEIEVYHSFYWPLEYKLAKRDENKCYAKLVTVKSEKERVVGFHVVGPNAGEITQGFGLGLKLGATKADFDNMIGIHPTCAEIFTTLSVSKSSGDDVEVAGC